MVILAIQTTHKRQLGMNPPTLPATLAAAALLIGTLPTRAADHFVSLTGGHVPPFTSWADAATNLQAAVDAASAGETVWVTNGVYASGGKVKAGSLTNRVALDKALTLQSVNGAAVTMIEGAWDVTTTNGPGAVRCAWLADGAILRGFTLRDGATANSGETTTLLSGGAVWGSNTNARVEHCLLTNSRAFAAGGAAIGLLLSNCTVIGNSSGSQGGGVHSSLALDSSFISNASADGGGAFASELRRCLLFGNSARLTGGGLSGGRAMNCRVQNNSSAGLGGGASGSLLSNSLVLSNTAISVGGTHQCYLVNSTVTANTTATPSGNVLGGGLTNCIVWGNFSLSPSTVPNVFAVSRFSYSCTTPALTGIGNISADPQLVDGLQLATTSPCRGTGSAVFASGTDLDGKPWANPPSMGCSEVWEADSVGPLTVALEAPRAEIATCGKLLFTGHTTGRASRLEWSFGDAITRTNLGWQVGWSWPAPGDYSVTVRAFNVDNPAGVSASMLVHVVPCDSPMLSLGAVQPSTRQLTFPGQFGVSYLVQRTTNLVPPVTWQNLTGVTSTGQVMQVLDYNATNAARFYRTLVP